MLFPKEHIDAPLFGDAAKDIESLANPDGHASADRTIEKLLNCIESLAEDLPLPQKTVLGSILGYSHFNLARTQAAYISLFDHLEQSISDLPDGVDLKDRCKKAKETLATKTCAINHSQAIEYVQFFLSANQNHLSPKQIEGLENFKADIFTYKVKNDLCSKTGSVERLGYLRANFEISTSVLYAQKKSIPTPDEVFENLLAKTRERFQIDSDKWVSKMQQLRLQIPAAAQEQVLLYEQSGEEVRRARETYFNASFKGGRQEGTKRHFIRWLAENFNEALLQIGLPKSAINQMHHTGKLPFNEMGLAYNLSVDHVIDRDMGGANALNNFVLVSATLNSLKNQFKDCQLRSAYGQQYNKERGWYINWAPRNREIPILIATPQVEIHPGLRKGPPCCDFE